MMNISQDDQIAFGKAAYLAYGKTTGNKNYQGLEMPAWEELTPTIRSAWVNAAQGVIDHMVVTIPDAILLRTGAGNVKVEYRHGG